MRVPVRSAADQLVDYCATIVAADPLRRWRGFEDILSKDAVHLMGLILRTAASIPLAQRATFSLGRWSTCTSHQTHRFPHDDYSKFVWELETILGWPEFVLWAAEEDRKAGHLGTETEVEEAWQKYSDFLKHILGGTLSRSRSLLSSHFLWLHPEASLLLRTADLLFSPPQDIAKLTMHELFSVSPYASSSLP